MKITRVAYTTVIAAALNAVSGSISSLLTLTPAGGSDSQNRFALVVAFCLSAVCSFGFFLALYRYLENAPSPIPLRVAGLAAAIATSLSLVAATLLYIHLRAWNFWVYLVPSVGWICFFALFYANADPLRLPPVRALAGVLALVSGYRAYMEFVQLPNLIFQAFQGLAIASSSLYVQPWFRVPVTVISLFYHVCLLGLMAMIALETQRKSDAMECLQDIPGRVV